MIDGLWAVQFVGVQGNGGGVVVFMKGHVLGGDSGFVYTGSYQSEENVITARVMVRNLLTGVPNVLGIQGDFELNVKGTVEGNTIKGSASLAKQQGAGIVVKLTKVADLPT